MDLQFHVAREASQSWQKAKGTSYMAADKREDQMTGVSPYKTIRSHETYSLLWEWYRGNHHDSMISQLVPPTAPGSYGSYNSRWYLGGDTAKPYYSDPGPSKISCPHISKPIMPSQQSPKVLTYFSINSEVHSPRSHLRQGKSLPPMSPKNQKQVSYFPDIMGVQAVGKYTHSKWGNWWKQRG